ncbi:hypothetical protein BH24ACI5_BH24ACI5_22750 [soil metagenome]
MKHRLRLIVCGLAVAAASALAAAAHSQADPISGAWGQGKTTLLQLAFDGKKEVSGTIFSVNPGGTTSAPIRTGTFDQASGALSLAGEIKGPEGQMVPYLIEGTLASGTLSLNFSIADKKGSVSLTRIADAGGGAAASPAPAGSADSAATLRKHFEDVSALVLKAADLVPDDKYSYRPTPTVRTFGELVGHIADSYVFYCGRASEKTEPGDGANNALHEKTALMRRLTDATSACTASAGTDTEALIGNIAHTNLHYGNLITYIRMLGLVPPSS